MEDNALRDILYTWDTRQMLFLPPRLDDKARWKHTWIGSNKRATPTVVQYSTTEEEISDLGPIWLAGKMANADLLWEKNIVISLKRYGW
jgi:hypothetical protein